MRSLALTLLAAAGPAAAHIPEVQPGAGLVLAWNTEAWLLALVSLGFGLGVWFAAQREYQRREPCFDAPLA